ncbi:MAG: CoA-transferase [Syntrophales bacterium]|jgi:glutaconate CoA-transferase subunit B
MSSKSIEELVAILEIIPDEPAKIGEFALPELMAIACSHEVKDSDIVFAGTGLPMVGIMTANLLHAPHAALIYEAGICDGKTMHTPMSVCDGRASYMASTLGGLVDTFAYYLQRGYVSLGFLGGAAIDQFGGVNVTCIGDNYFKPDNRLTGSGGNSDIGTMAKRTVFIMLQEKRRFVERNEYTTTPGWWCWDWKKREWKPKREALKNSPFADCGPEAVVTNMGIFRFDEKGIMYLESYHPGVTVEKIANNCNFGLNISRVKGETRYPTYRELFVLREFVDPELIFMSERPEYPEDVRNLL